MGYKGIGYIGNETHRGKVVQGAWGTWPIRPTGGMGYRGTGGMGTWAIDTGAYCQYLLDQVGDRGDGVHGSWGTWAMGHMGDWAHGHNFTAGILTIFDSI